MKTQTITWASRCLALLAVFVLLMTSCGPMGARPVTSSGGLQAWIDQPITGYTLAPQPLTLKAHASQEGGGVYKIRFTVNGTELASVPTDEGQELAAATTEWNPSEEGWYDIQAVAVNSAGQEAMSEVSHICISRGGAGACGAAPVAAEAEVDSSMTVNGSPDPVSIGASCDPASRIVTFTATVPDMSGAMDAEIRGHLVGASGGREEILVILSAGTPAGTYTGMLDLGTLDNAVLGGADGTLEYAVSLINEAKEYFRTSATRTLTVHYCGGAAPAQGTVDVGGGPNPVFIGECSPTEIDFVAKTDIDPGMFDRLDLAYGWFNAANVPIGTETRAEMASSDRIVWQFHLDVNTAPSGMSDGGLIRYKAVVVNTDNADIVASNLETIVINPCNAPVQPGIPPAVCSDFNYQQQQCLATKDCYYWKDGTCTTQAEPQAVPCSTYTGQPNKCKAQPDCNLWSDGTCSEKPEPFVPTPSCESFNGDLGACKNSGYCWAWSDDSCRDYAEPAPSCTTYLKPDECKAAGCTWDQDKSYCY